MPPTKLETTLTIGAKVEVKKLSNNQKYGVVRWLGFYGKDPVVGLEMVRLQKNETIMVQLSQIVYLY